MLGAGFANFIDSRPAAPDVENATGKIAVPLDMGQIGFWLAAALGRVSATGGGPYTHAFVSGAITAGNPLPSMFLERGFVTSQYEAMRGAAIKTLKLPFGPGVGYQQVDLELMGAQVLEPITRPVRADAAAPAARTDDRNGVDGGRGGAGVAEGIGIFIGSCVGGVGGVEDLGSG